VYFRKRGQVLRHALVSRLRQAERNVWQRMEEASLYRVFQTRFTRAPGPLRKCAGLSLLGFRRWRRLCRLTVRATTGRIYPLRALGWSL